MIERDTKSPLKKVTVLPTATKEDMIRSEAVHDTYAEFKKYRNNPKALLSKAFDDIVSEKI